MTLMDGQIDFFNGVLDFAHTCTHTHVLTHTHTHTQRQSGKRRLGETVELKSTKTNVGFYLLI